MRGEAPMSVSRLMNLVHWLPETSAVHRALDPDGIGVGWNLHGHLLAVIAEVTDNTNMILAKVYGAKGAPQPKPLRITRPGREPEPKNNTLGDFMALESGDIVEGELVEEGNDP